MSSREQREKEYYDLCYDVWRSGGNPDSVNRDTFEGYDSIHGGELDAELRRQKGTRGMSYCVMCGAPIPDDQGSRTCSMCYGDIDHGKDGYYREWAEDQDRRSAEDDHEKQEEQI